MYQQLLDALKKKFTGVNDKILERMAKKLAKTTKTEEEVQTAVDGVTFQQIIDSEGDRRANEATDTAVRNYETKHNLKDGKPVQQPDDDDDDINGNDDDDDEPADDKKGKGKGKGKKSRTEKLLEQILKKQQEQDERFNSLQQERTGNSRKAKLEALLKDADEKVRTRYLRDYDRLNFKDDADFDAWLEERTTDIESDINDARASGGVTTPPKGGKQTRKEGEVDPNVTAYLNTEAAHETQNQFSTMAGLPNAAPAASGSQQ